VGRMLAAQSPITHPCFGPSGSLGLKLWRFGPRHPLAPSNHYRSLWICPCADADADNSKNKLFRDDLTKLAIRIREVMEGRYSVN